ncbi:EamA family transporter [Sinomonas atrocyanea]
MVSGALTIALLAVVGLLPLGATFGTVALLGGEVSWVVPLAGITLVAAVLAYTFGIIGTQRLGSKVASFVSLTEVLFSVVASWIMIGDVPGPVQFVGGALIVAGVIMVRMDELRAPASAVIPDSAPEALPAADLATGSLPAVNRPG